MGNEFRGDDALGIKVVRQLENKYAHLADYMIEQSDLTRILEQWKDRKVIIVDAVFTPDPQAGKIYETRSFHDLPFGNKKNYSSHGVDLPDIYALGKSIGSLPRSIHFIGVEGVSWEIGSPMRAEVLSAIDEVVKIILQHMT